MCSIRNVARLSLCGALLFAVTAAQAQSIDKLDLDRTLAFGGGELAELFSAEGALGFSYPDVFDGNTLVSCQLTPFDGLYCIDFKEVRSWAAPMEDGTSMLIVDCTDATLGLDARKDNTCTSVVVDADGVIWLGGKDKGKANTLIKFVAADGICTPLVYNTGLCAVEVASGRPLLLDLVAVEGLGILALEGGKALVAFKNDGTTEEIASGKGDFLLQGPEQLSSLSFLTFDDRNFALLATTTGRILAWDLAGTGPATEALGSVTWSAATDGCNAVPGFAVDASPNSGLVYMSSGASCEFVALEPALVDGDFVLEVAGGPVATGLATTTGVTSAPGNVVNLANCGGDSTCTLEKAGGIELSQVTLGSTASGLTYFHVEGVPDCRWLPGLCDHAIVGDGGPWQTQLNITALLPADILDKLDNPPPMLIPHYVRGQYKNGFMISGLFGIAEPGVLFRDTFVLEYDFEDPDTGGFECTNYLNPPVTPYPDPWNRHLLDWAVVGTVSETFPWGDGPRSFFVTNFECGSQRGREIMFSFKPYNLEPTPCTYNPVVGDVWVGDGYCPQDMDGNVLHDEVVPDDAVYAKMLLTMVDEYASIVADFACLNGDENPAVAGPAPLDGTVCPLVELQVANMTDKLHKCWDAAQLPKQSSSNQNCQSFDSQLANLQDLLDSDYVYLADGALDPANRLGELKARAMIMRHVFETRFTPSLLILDEEHFVEPQPAPSTP